MTVGRITSRTALGVAALAAVGVLAVPASEAASPAPATVVSVRALPTSMQHAGTLSPRTLNTVTASTALGFKVVVRNESRSSTAATAISVSISRATFHVGQLVVRRPLPAIPAGHSRFVTVTHLGEVPFASRTTLTVRIAGAPARSFPVIFALPSGNSAPSVSAGARTAVPNVAGRPEQSAINRLHAGGFGVYVVEVYSQRPAGEIVAQSPRSPIRLAKGGVVTIDVSDGKPPSHG